MRFIQIIWVLSKYIILYKLTSHRLEILGERLKSAFEELGITFIKIGQILSMRYDILPKKDAQALRSLLDDVKQIPLEDIYSILELEYGKSWNQIFVKFESIPLGSASISQVYKAELFDGSAVAVKIKRPNVDDKFAQDIKIMKLLASFSQYFSKTLRNIQLKNLVESFEQWIKQDLDFKLEVVNMEKVCQQYSFALEGFRVDLGKGYFPKPFKQLCNDKVIVMDFMQGVPLNRREEILNNPLYDVEKTIKSYANAALRNWFRDDIEMYYMQGDPHLSNILVLPDGDASIIDFGLILTLSFQETRISRELMIAVYIQDIHRVMRVAAKMMGITVTEAEVMREDLLEYLEKTTNEGFGFWFLEFARIAIKHNFKFPLYLATFGRANLLLDGIIHEYMPHKTTIDLLGDELRRVAVKEMFKEILDADWIKIPYAISNKISQTPNIISDFLNSPLKIASEVISSIKVTK